MGPSGEVLLDERDPACRCQRVRTTHVLEADLADDDELAGEPGHPPGFFRVVDGYRAVGHLDVSGAHDAAQSQPFRNQPVQRVALEQGAAEVEIDAGAAQDVDFPLDVLGDQAGTPAELHEIDEFADAVYRVFELGGEHSWIDDHREPTLPRFGLEVR